MAKRFVPVLVPGGLNKVVRRVTPKPKPVVDETNRHNSIRARQRCHETKMGVAPITLPSLSHPSLKRLLED